MKRIFAGLRIKRKAPQHFCRDAIHNRHKLLKSNFCSNFFQFLLHFLSLILGNAFLDYLRSALNGILCFFQAQTGDFTYHLDNLNLLSANLGQLNVELGLLFLYYCRASCCYNNACCCAYAELFLASFY